MRAAAFGFLPGVMDQRISSRTATNLLEDYPNHVLGAARVTVYCTGLPPSARISSVASQVIPSTVDSVGQPSQHHSSVA
jgi:hypothetical protein